MKPTERSDVSAGIVLAFADAEALAKALYAFRGAMRRRGPPPYVRWEQEQLGKWKNLDEASRNLWRQAAWFIEKGKHRPLPPRPPRADLDDDEPF